MTKYIVSVTRTLVVEADSEGEATTMSLYATAYPDHITGIEYINYDAKAISNKNEIQTEKQNRPEDSSN